MPRADRFELTLALPRFVRILGGFAGGCFIGIGVVMTIGAVGGRNLLVVLAFGLVSVLVGLAICGMMLLEDRWVFDRARGDVVHDYRLLVVTLREERMGLRDVRALRLDRGPDFDGDTGWRLVLELHDGRLIDLHALALVHVSRAALERLGGDLSRFLRLQLLLE